MPVRMRSLPFPPSVFSSMPNQSRQGIANTFHPKVAPLQPLDGAVFANRRHQTTNQKTKTNEH